MTQRAADMASAVERLRTAQRNYAFVVGADGRFEGTVSIDSMLQALGAIQPTLASAFLKDVAPVPDSLSLNALVGRIIKNPFPLAVVDGTQRYLGAVTQTILLKRMAIEESEHE